MTYNVFGGTLNLAQLISKINWLPQQSPLGYHKTYVSFVIPIHVTTYDERLMKIGLEVGEIFGRIC